MPLGEESQAVRKTNRVREKRRGRNCVRFRDGITPARVEWKWN
jgi:streptomycin 6-kinase